MCCCPPDTPGFFPGGLIEEADDEADGATGDIGERERPGGGFHVSLDEGFPSGWFGWLGSASSRRSLDEKAPSSGMRVGS